MPLRNEETVIHSEAEALSEWIGRSERHSDTVTAAPLNGLAAMLNRDDPEFMPGSDAPALSHWLYFAPSAQQRELDSDGHPKRGGFLPPVPLPHRMWAGGRIDFLHPLRVGDEITRLSRIARVDSKSGRSGPLVFVTVRHEISSALGLALCEEQDIVYRDAPGQNGPLTAPEAAPEGAAYWRDIVPDPMLLFRYSALTFNAHRIHYDRPYATQIEGYSGLVAHSPLTATLLADLLRRARPDATFKHFSFTAVRPLFDTHTFTLCASPAAGKSFQLWTRDHEGYLTMRAQAQLL